jgi:ABC-type transporter Mla MlaB component
MAAKNHMQQGNQVPSISIVGGMTIFQAAQLKTMLIESLNDVSCLEVDLAEVSEIDTTGLQLLMALKHQQKPVTLINASHCIVQVATLMGVLQPLDFLIPVQTQGRIA